MDLLKSDEYSLKVRAAQLSAKKASEIISEGRKKFFKTVMHLFLCISGIAIAVFFAANALIVFQAVFLIGFSAHGFVQGKKELKKFSEKEFVAMASEKK